MGASNSTRKITIVSDGEGLIEVSRPVIDRIENAVKKTREPTQQEEGQAQSQSDWNDQKPPLPAWNGESSFEYPSDFGSNGVYIPMDMLRLRQKHQEELEMVHRFNQSKISRLEQQNNLLFAMTREKLDKNVSQVEQKYTSVQKHEPVCVEAEKMVESCYLSNPGLPLKCSKQAKDFINCIDHIRRQVL